jgi:hypothetical protein
MEKETRVNKYKKLREEIAQMDSNRFESPYHLDDSDESNEIGMSDEELQNAHVKKNTLSLSIDQIVKAHDEYTTIMEKKDIEAQAKQEKKLKQKKMLFKLGILLGILVFVALIAVIIVIVVN